MTPLDLIIICLATYRLAYMAVREDAPFGIMRRIRNLLGATAEACIEQRQAGRITNALCCVDCASVWAAAIVVFTWAYAPALVWVLAATGATVIYNRHFG